MATARARAGALWRSERGASLPLVAASILPMIGAVGSATDLGRIYIAKSQMQAGVDAAALAGARAFNNTDGTSSDRNHQVSAYFTGNFPDGYMGMPTISPTPLFQTVAGVNQTTVTAQGDLPMAFMQLFGKRTQRISVIAKASLQPRPLEVMVVLDNTGSMANMLDGTNTSMDALKTSMHNFITALYQGSTTRSDLAMGIINYTVTTNVGDILKKYGVSVKELIGFTSAGPYSGQVNFTWPSQPLAWKGCVADDPTHVDMSSNLSVKESDAYDIQRTLPGEGNMPAITPFFYPPVYLPYSLNNANDPTSNYYKVLPGMDIANNMFLMDAGYGSSIFDFVANQNYAKPYFYKFYIGLNDGYAGVGNDVVVTNNTNDASNTTTYWAPASNFDPAAPGNLAKYKIVTSRIPHVSETSYWRQPSAYQVQGSKSSSGNWQDTAPPSPNFQCPEAGMEVGYGRTKSTYDNFIDNKVAPVTPAIGTMHHIGFLWGYRLLVRDDVFTRTNPTTEKPKRAIVFMTDGRTDLIQGNNYNDRFYTAYGATVDKTLINDTDYSKFKSAEELRFKKTCEAAKAETNPPLIFIVALNRGGNDMNSDTRSMFQGCATGGYFETTSTTAINSAFTTIAQELIDLHLTQ
ncbi:TadE/TadG family type IV pilus assembly protein [Sphingomonas sp.]|uniref:TadE/TadG family type IV pilus assembly protein n=1 Tax=Sphingomonas sp. TaxID=28214 RepID=UPI003B009117